jgi:hypothetical protein
MTLALFVAVVLAAFGVIVATPVSPAPLPGYLGEFGRVRRSLPPELAPAFVYTFDQHECAERPLFANKVNPSPVDPLMLSHSGIVTATCRTGTDAFEDTPIHPGFNMTNGDATFEDYLFARIDPWHEAWPQLVPWTTFEMWITVNFTESVSWRSFTLVEIGKSQLYRHNLEREPLTGLSL